MAVDFEEIAHSGGKITFNVRTDENGRRAYQPEISTQSYGPVVIYGLYALPLGIPVGPIRMGGIGDAWNPPPIPGCFPVLIASDSQGKFGHACHRCAGYWRAGPWVTVCPYCAWQDQSHHFLSQAQARYVKHYCDILAAALDGKDGETVIDMDSIAKAARSEGEKPAFYMSEESQQCKFTCTACNEFNDILGRFGYCSVCGTRNDLADFESTVVPAIRSALNAQGKPEDAVRSAVSAFDSLVAQYAKQLADLVPLTERRVNRLRNQRFHNLENVRDLFNEWFDINICDGISEEECKFISLMFHRRHVYEHNGGEADAKYLSESGDNSVKLKQQIRETQESAHRLLSFILKMARNLHNGFHELFPPASEPIQAYADKKARIACYEQEHPKVKA